MKKILIVILVLLLIFALIRITTSTYENINRSSHNTAMVGRIAEEIYETEKCT